MNTNGLIHIYCGEGKGKTTAALGLAVRSAGRGMKVVLLRLMKDSDSGELLSLSQIPAVTVIRTPDRLKFIHKMTDAEKEEYKALVKSMLGEAASLVEIGACDLLIIDEACSAVSSGILALETLLDFLKNKPTKLEVILTGRNPAPELVEIADYVSEIKKIKHPFDAGIGAREGIEL